MTKRIAIVGGGIAGITAAWQIAQLSRKGADVEATLFEAFPRLGGIVETIHHQGFTIESGPDAWVTEKPWARDLAVELGLEDQLLPSNDLTRKTHIFLNGHLETMPDGMRMMVPTDLDAIDRSPLFSPAAKLAYHHELTRAAELKASAPHEHSATDGASPLSTDESIANFTRRHFGEEVLTRIAAPLLSGVLGGDVETLSVQAVMPQFVAMERAHGSLIAALQSRSSQVSTPIFTTLRSGLGSLIDHLVAETPAAWLHRNTTVTSISRSTQGWQVRPNAHPQHESFGAFDELFLATPPYTTQRLLRPLDLEAAGLLTLESSSAIVVALAYATQLTLPPGFGFLVPPSSGNQLLACTFVDQKFNARVPSGARLLRAFFGGHPAEALLREPDNHLANLARQELAAILGPLPEPAFTIVRRWPRSLPQYAVGHLARMSELSTRIATHPGLTLLGNAYRGVGLPDLVRDARAAARRSAT